MEKNDEEMRANYPYFRAFVLAKMKEEFAQSLEPVSDSDLGKIAQEEGGLPLTAFIEEIETGKDV